MNREELRSRIIDNLLDYGYIDVSIGKINDMLNFIEINFDLDKIQFDWINHCIIQYFSEIDNGEEHYNLTLSFYFNDCVYSTYAVDCETGDVIEDTEKKVVL